MSEVAFSDFDRFCAFFTIDPDGCWRWHGGIGGHYGRFWHRGRMVQAHRFAYEALRSAIPTGLTLDHLCQLQLCVNPDHLEPTSMGDNVRRFHDRHGHKLPWRVKDTCRRGHPRSERYPSGSCATCMKITKSEGDVTLEDAEAPEGSES